MPSIALCSGTSSFIFLCSAVNSIYQLVFKAAGRAKGLHRTHQMSGGGSKSANYRLIENLVDPDETIIQRDEHDANPDDFDITGMMLLFRRAERDKKRQQSARLENLTAALVAAAGILQVLRAYNVAHGGGATFDALDAGAPAAAAYVEALAWFVGVLLIKVEDAHREPRSYVVLMWFFSMAALRLVGGALLLGGSAAPAGDAQGLDLGLWCGQLVALLGLAYCGAGTIQQHRRSEHWRRFKDAKARLRVLGQSKFGRLMRLAQQDTVYIVVAIGAASTVAGCTIMFNIIWGGLIAEVQQSNQPGLQALIYELAGVCATLGVASFVQAYYTQIAGVRLILRIQNLAYSSLVEQEVAFFDANKTGELMTVLGTNAQMVQAGLTTNLVNAVKGGVTVAGIMTYLFLVSWRLTLIFTSCALIPFMLLACLGVLVAKFTKAQTDAQAVMGNLAQETLSCMSTVKSFAQEEQVKANYRNASQTTYFISKKLTVVTAALTMVGLGGFYGVFAVGFDVGGILAIEGKIEASFLLSFVLLSFQMIMNLGAVVAAIPAIATAVGASQRIFELLDRQPAIRYSGGSVPKRVKGAITFEDVHFHYPSRPQQQILRGITATIAAGQQVAFVGPSGSGKSTLLALVQGFYRPTSGRITLDGYSVEELDPMWLRRQIGVVLQEPVLFSGTILFNLSFGMPDATHAQVEQAARDANAHDFIARLPDGYLTELGERGVSLSGGQKQRIAIARALLKDPRLLLLDEATSALDSESEDFVQDALDRLMENRTTLVIAHRLSTIEDSDMICVVEMGKIVETGTHASLLEQGGLYASLCRKDDEE